MTTIRTAEHAMDPTTRKAALAASLFYIGTFVFSIPALGLYDGVEGLPDPDGHGRWRRRPARRARR